MSNEKVLAWAKGEQANVIEPLEYLKENGWRYGDVPMASNINWLFKSLTEELAVLRKDIFVLKDDVNRLREDTTNSFAANKVDIANLKKETAKEIESIRKSMATEIASLRKDFDTSTEWVSVELASVKRGMSDLKDSTTNRFNTLTQNMTKEFSAVKIAMDAAMEQTEHEIATALEKTAATFAEVRLEAVQIREKTNEALRRTVGHNYALVQLGFVGRRICQQLRSMETDIKKLVPGYPAREWPADENLSAVPYEELESSNDE